jgi:hypothetical protein
MGKFDIGNKPKKPFVYTGKKPINPFYKIETETNGPDRFAIIKTTDNGKYIRGNMLFYNYKGIEIYTDINNAIFVDTINNTLTIRDYSKTLEEINPTDPEDRQYVLIIVSDEDAEDDGLNMYTWDAMIGRTTMYNYIVNNIDIKYIDPDKSIVLTDNVALKDALSVTQFVNYLKNGNLVPEDDFNIDDYRSGGEDDE